MATKFTVEGPFKIPSLRGKAAKIVNSESAKLFWQKHPELAGERGCYVFAMRAASGFTPGYVGMATKSFKREAFQPHKLAKYQAFLANYHKGSPVLFFVVAPAKRGKPNVSHIALLEDYLIQNALKANPDLLNIKGTKQARWSIAGILRSGKGNASKSAKALKRALKL